MNEYDHKNDNKNECEPTSNESTDHELSYYDYDLPKELIAQHPLADRTSARLLVCNRENQTLTDRYIRDLPEILQPGDCLVLNDSRVIPARLVGFRQRTGGHWEGLFLGSQAASDGVGLAWKILGKTRGKLQPGERITLEAPSDASSTPSASSEQPLPSIRTLYRLEYLDRLETGEMLMRPWIVRIDTHGASDELQLGERRAIHPNAPPHLTPQQRVDAQRRQQLAARRNPPVGGGVCAEEHVVDQTAVTEPFAFLEQIGRVPLPPYIRHGEAETEDRNTYQTVFAKEPGSVAAPTAGLHFTEALLDQIRQRGVEIAYVTLHVGMGTFKPITSEHLADHTMHTEWIRMTPETATQLRACQARGGRIIPIGTTAMRVLETASREGEIAPFIGETNLFIRPPFEFHAANALLTNFHFPKTTLLVLVRTFGGDELLRRAYEHAVDERYRFFSYGDAMLIL